MIESVYIVNPGDISMPRGGESRVIAFANSLNNNGFDVHLIVPKPVNEIPEKLQNISIHTVPVYSRGGNIKNQFFKALYLSKKARRMVNQNNAALQLEHSPFAGFAAFVGCSKFVLDMHEFGGRTGLGNMSYRTNAETMARFVLGDPDLPDEPHTSLEDCLWYELPVLLKLVNTTKKKRWMNPAPYNWRDYQIKNWYQPV